MQSTIVASVEVRTRPISLTTPFRCSPLHFPSPRPRHRGWVRAETETTGDAGPLETVETTPVVTPPVNYVDQEEPFTLTRISFGSILSPIGVGLMVFGFCAYFDFIPGGDISPLLLVYGFPLSLLGFALKYAELKPVPCQSTQEALDLRETQMTDIQKQVREDTTRYSRRPIDSKKADSTIFESIEGYMPFPLVYACEDWLS